MSVGDNIRNARISQGLNQKELVEKLAEKGVNVGNTTISNWEKGISKPDPDTITILCEILNVDANYILGFYKNKSANNIEEIQVLLDAYQGLSETDKEFMRNMIIERRKLIDKQLEEKGQ